MVHPLWKIILDPILILFENDYDGSGDDESYDN